MQDGIFSLLDYIPVINNEKYQLTSKHAYILAKGVAPKWLLSQIQEHVLLFVHGCCICKV